MLSSTQVLVVASEPELLSHVHTSFEDDQVTTVGSSDDAIEMVSAGLNPNLVFLELCPMSACNGLHTLVRLKQTHPLIKVIAVSSSGDTRQAVEAMRLGAQECLVKPFSKSEFETVVARCLGPIRVAGVKNRQEIEDVGEGRFLVTSCPAMAKIRSYCGFVAKVDLPVLILGESGTGKEVVARLIHKISSRANRPFLKVNCAAMPADLLESELFGYEPGAFTGATHAKPGKFEQANRGTILLDEIGEMPTNLQAKLLHVLQDQQFSRLGGRTAMKVDVQILAATNIDIQEALASHKLREDLYYRLNAFVVRMPPLRERKEEIGFLLEHFVSQQAEQWNIEPMPLSPHVLEACQRYSWPGNVRELENFAKRFLVLRDEHTAIAELSVHTSEHSASSPQNGKTRVSTPPRVPPISDHGIANLKSVARSAMSEAEAIAISQALNRTRWNRKRAAELLDVSYKALLYKIKQYDLERPSSAAAD
jgi:two-component system, NtrC family, response regulator AtoC